MSKVAIRLGEYVKATLFTSTSFIENGDLKFDMASAEQKRKKCDILDWLSMSEKSRSNILKKRAEYDEARVLVRSHYRKKVTKKGNCTGKKAKKTSKSKNKPKAITEMRYCNRFEKRNEETATATAIVTNTQALLIDDIVK